MGEDPAVGAVAHPPRRAPAPVRPRGRDLARQALAAVLVSLVLAVFVREFVVRGLVIAGPSMADGLLVGDHLLVNRWLHGRAAPGGLGRLLPLRSPRRGDVVVLRSPLDARRRLVKRCVGLPGDEIEMFDRRLRINGQEIDERAYVRSLDRRTYHRSSAADPAQAARESFGPLLVPPACYFVLGDNRDDSEDSRVWGAVPERALEGRAWLVYWSRETLADRREEGAVGVLRRALWAPLAATRWHRCGLLVR